MSGNLVPRARRLATAVLVALVMAPVAVAGAQTDGGSSTTFSCGSPPEGVTATPEDRDRFVALWAPRVTDEAFLQSFIDAPTVPPAIEAEGFHSLDALSQGWLVVCLVDRLIATVGVDGNAPGVTPDPLRLRKVQAALGLVIFGKAALNQLREQATKTTPVSDPAPSPQQTALTAATQELASTPPPAPPDTSGLVPATPNLQALTDLTSTSTATLTDLLAGNPQTVAVQAGAGLEGEVRTPVASADATVLLSTGLNGTVAFPVLGRLVDIIESLLQNIADVPSDLLALPPLNVLGGATYRVCRESATQPLACTIPVPVGVPVPVGLTDDLVPDVTAHLTPQPDLFAPQDVTAGFTITRLATAPPGPLPYHVFAVYDPPLSGKRIEFGFDGRKSTIADRTNGSVTVKNGFSTLQGDINVLLEITHENAGAEEAATVAVKTLVNQGTLEPVSEEDPLTAAVSFTPVPATLTGDLRVRRPVGSEQTTLTVTSSVESLVEAHVNRDLTTTTPKSHQEVQARIDKLPTSTTVDLIRQAAQTKLHYFANAPISQVTVQEKSLADVNQPGTFVESKVDVQGVPKDVNVTLTGGSDILYTADAAVPKAQVETRSYKDSVLQTSILGAVEQIPTSVHLNFNTGGDTTTGTYDADASLGKAAVMLYDKVADETIVTASATSFPTHIAISATKSTGVLDYSANGPIATIDAKLTRAGGSTLSLPGDHATVFKQGPGLGAELLLSGLEAFRVEPTEKAKYSLTLNPGGQPFKAMADLDDPNVLATLDVSNLPSMITVTMDPAAGSASYNATSVIDGVKAKFEQRTTGMIGLAELEAIPETVKVTWSPTGATPQVTYDASGKLGKLYGLYVEKPGGTSFDATIESLPEWFKVSGQDPFGFDARSGPNAAPGSSSIGKMTFRYASDGTFATAPTTDDHLVLQTGAATKAELVYSGLRLVSTSTANKELHVDLRNTTKRTFRAYLDSPALLVEGVIAGVPDEVKFDLVGQNAKYAATSTVDQVAVDIDRRNGESVAVDVTGIPATIDLTMDGANAKVDWTASGPTGGLGVVARFGPPTLGGSRNVDSSLTLTGIPATWRVGYGGGHPKWEGLSGPIGTIAATFTNHGSATVLTGDHLSAVFDQSSGDLDASLRISNLSLAEFEKLANGFKANLKMGNGSPFGLNASVNLGTSQATVTGSISNLPSDVHVESVDGRIQYTGDTNPNIQLSAQYGTAAGLAAAPNPSSVHGLAVRDGSGQSVKANLYLTGFPKVMDFNPKAGTYTVDDFAPTATMVIDVNLDDIVPSPLTALVTQAGIPAGVDFTFGPTTSETLGDGTVKTHAGYIASAAMGKLTVTASFGSDEAYFETSTVPQSLSVDLEFGAATKKVTVGLGTAISLLKAMYKHAGDDEFAAGVTLTDVPTSVNLIIGSQDGGQGVTVPVFSYHASGAGLDLVAFAKASLFGGDVKAKVDLNVTNFGKDVTAGIQGTTVQLASEPPTGSFNLLASGRLQFDIDLGFDAGPLHNTGNLQVTVDIFELNLAFTDLTNLTLKAGITSAIEGNYGTFTLGERSNVNLQLTDRLVIDTGFGDYELFDIDPPISVDVGNVVGNFRMATNHEGDWITALPTPVPCDVSIIPPDVDFAVITVTLRPHPHGTTPGPSFTVSSATAEGGAHIVTVNPFGAIPDLVLDIIARFASPNGGGQSLGTACPD